ncbi:MAG: phosphoenolpyruvate--protein phosphotransferase [Clostridiales Family XIII bacterium]|jgi:phosphotransferase system enzyme I (PtsI)|nr:phosphoenolpyruvate--protein phosphotransferase [Clostridiales Family XIII bacterium]
MIGGIPAAPGIAIGKAYIYRNKEIAYREGPLDDSEIQNQLLLLTDAMRSSVDQLHAIVDEASKAGDGTKAQIMETHLAILDDVSFTDEMKAGIMHEHMFAETAVRKVSEKYEAVFAEMDDEYMRGRAADIADICLRVIKNIIGVPVNAMGEVHEPCVLIARDLTPSDTAQLDKDLILAFCTEQGGSTSHSAIIAKARGIPAVMGLKDIATRLADGDTVIVDGYQGHAHINPDAETLDTYLRLKAEDTKRKETLDRNKHLPPETRDGHRVTLLANIGSVEDGSAALENGAKGVGLFRTEFIYMGRDTLPTEDEQFAIYKTVAGMMNPYPVSIRTLDIGGDKSTPCINIPHEDNPFLGWRAIRISLSEKDMFKTQIRAILRASAYGNIRIMYPMIAEMTELRKANDILRECKEELKADHIDYDADIEAGVMIETPAAAVAADILMKEATFFSIGTNDLTQYVMAADRMNERVSYLCDPLSPSVLRLIKHAIDESHKENAPICMCGEMAGDPKMTSILVGLGLDELSMSASSIPSVNDAIRKLSFEEVQALAIKALTMDTAEDIAGLLAASHYSDAKPSRY